MDQTTEWPVRLRMPAAAALLDEKADGGSEAAEAALAAGVVVDTSGKQAALLVPDLAAAMALHHWCGFVLEVEAEALQDGAFGYGEVTVAEAAARLWVRLAVLGATDGAADRSTQQAAVRWARDAARKAGWVK